MASSQPKRLNLVVLGMILFFKQTKSNKHTMGKYGV